MKEFLLYRGSFNERNREVSFVVFINYEYMNELIIGQRPIKICWAIIRNWTTRYSFTNELKGNQPMLPALHKLSWSITKKTTIKSLANSISHLTDHNFPFMTQSGLSAGYRKNQTQKQTCSIDPNLYVFHSQSWDVSLPLI